MSEFMLIKYEQFSSLSTVYSYTIVDGEYEASTWVQARDEEIQRFNESPGACVYRQGTSTWYTESDLKDLNIDDLPGIPLPILAKVLLRLGVLS